MKERFLRIAAVICFAALCLTQLAVVGSATTSAVGAMNEEIFACDLVEFVPGNPHKPTKGQDTDSMLGVPDNTGDSEFQEYPLGKLGYAVFDFGIIFDSCYDITVYEVGSSTGNSAETVNVYVSTDGKEWVKAGTTTKNSAVISLDKVIPEGSEYRLVKVEDSGKNGYSSNWAGADIDAVSVKRTRFSLAEDPEKWATAVVEFIPGNPHKPDKEQDVTMMLGRKDNNSTSELQEYPLGKGGSVTFDFGLDFDNSYNINVYEVGSTTGNTAETVNVYVSSDNYFWYTVGTTDKDVDKFSLESVIPDGKKVRYVKLVDSGKNSYGGEWPGADIDAVSVTKLRDSVLADGQKETSFGSVASSWAVPEIENAYDNGLVPEILVGRDLTQSVTRAEFAAIAVHLYEQLSGKDAVAASENPFKDIDGSSSYDFILKAYEHGITNGTSVTEFSPYVNITREQMATMLTRTYKSSELAGWTMANDSAYPLDCSGVDKFADDAEISAYARESVYFMAKWGIVNGVGNNMFAPTGSATLREGYGYATREQAIVIALRTVTKFGD